MNSRISRSFYGLFGGYPGISEDEREIIGEFGDKEGEDSGENEVEDALENTPEVPQSSNLAFPSQTLVSETEPSLLKTMEQITQFMGQLTQAITCKENFKAPAFKTPSMNETDSFDDAQDHKFRRFIQSCQLKFHNNSKELFSETKKVLSSTSFLMGRAGKWIEP
ncbi:hypothetical protein O181_014679 [Austropuccinia psidii MF-1]|uniref:Uncharacterized protein n=1 Tax=Austropuccinia psidii MF-1 TaxID=1389203 RepID=A0A9Q3C0J1_9BASI|nr:hypothetical protein [Austropuccinia psidii MF-1]